MALPGFAWYLNLPLVSKLEACQELFLSKPQEFHYQFSAKLKENSSIQRTAKVCTKCLLILINRLKNVAVCRRAAAQSARLRSAVQASRKLLLSFQRSSAQATLLPKWTTAHSGSFVCHSKRTSRAEFAFRQKTAGVSLLKLLLQELSLGRRCHRVLRHSTTRHLSALSWNKGTLQTTSCYKKVSYMRTKLYGSFMVSPNITPLNIFPLSTYSAQCCIHRSHGSSCWTEGLVCFILEKAGN